MCVSTANKSRHIFFAGFPQRMEIDARIAQVCLHNNEKLVCEKKTHDQFSWKRVPLDDAHSSVACPMDSVPMDMHARCHGFDSCYRQGDHVKCLSPLNPSATQTPNEGLTDNAPVSHEMPISKAEVNAAFDACVVQPYAYASNTALIGYVKKNDRQACQTMLDQIRGECTTEECKQNVVDVYEHWGELGCALNHHKVPVLHSGYDEWFRWVRENRHTCKGEGWMCTDDAMTEYSPVPCSGDEECAQPVEWGVCDKPKGSTSGSGTCKTGVKNQCDEDEHCDVVNPVGVCSNGRCTAGKMGVEPVYYAPKQCTLPTENDSRKSKYNYCGENSKNMFTGVCTAYDHNDQQFAGCRAFTSEDEAVQFKHDEEQWQENHRQSTNFTSGNFEWERLMHCAEADYIVKGGRRMCSSTVEMVGAYTMGESCESVLLPYARQTS